MKKLWCILLLLLLPLAASAEEYHYTLSNGRRCQAVTFAAQAPEPLARALADSQFAEDELLCGVLLTHMRENPARVESRQALVALRHDGKTLLLWCSHSSETGWKLAVAAEDFLLIRAALVLVEGQQTVASAGGDGHAGAIFCRSEVA